MKDFVAHRLDGVGCEGLGLEDVADGVGGDDGELMGAEEAQEECGEEEGDEEEALGGFSGRGRGDHERGWYRKDVANSNDDSAGVFLEMA